MTGTDLSTAAAPKLAAHVRLRFDAGRGKHVLLGPESVAVLNATSAAILGLCDGRRTVPEIVAALRADYAGVADDEVRGFLAAMATKRIVEIDDD